jgi:hypothetical protein
LFVIAGDVLLVTGDEFAEDEPEAAAIDVKLLGFIPRSSYVRLSDPSKAVRSIS